MNFNSTVQWEAEVQRVLPLLIGETNESRDDWRNYYKILQMEMKTFSTEIERLATGIRVKEYDEFMSHVATVEQALQVKYRDEISRLKLAHEELDKFKLEEKILCDNLASLSSKLHQISSQLVNIKITVEEKGRSITDSSSLIQLKSSLQRLKTDVKDHDVHIGLLDHLCLQKRVFESKRRLESTINDAF